MKTLNKVFLIGSAGRDPEMRSTGGGTLVANLSIATTERYKDSQGNWQSKPEWHNLQAFGRTAEIIRDYVQKGSPVHIEGHLQTQQWEKDGQKHYKTVIFVEDLILLSSGEQANRSKQAQTPSSRQQQRPQNGQQQRAPQQQSRDRGDNTPEWGEGQEICDDDIPF